MKTNERKNKKQNLALYGKDAEKNALIHKGHGDNFSFLS